jgi:hypothetical protein
MRRKYTLDQLRGLLRGKRWEDFKKPRAYKYSRILNVGQVFFTLRVTKFLLRPVMEVRSEGQRVALQVIPIEAYENLCRYYLAYGQARWRNAVHSWGYIRAEDNEPVEAAQDVA